MFLARNIVFFINIDISQLHRYQLLIDSQVVYVFNSHFFEIFVNEIVLINIYLDFQLISDLQMLLQFVVQIFITSQTRFIQFKLKVVDIYFTVPIILLINVQIFQAPSHVIYRLDVCFVDFVLIFHLVEKVIEKFRSIRKSIFRAQIFFL